MTDRYPSLAELLAQEKVRGDRYEKALKNIAACAGADAGGEMAYMISVAVSALSYEPPKAPPAPPPLRRVPVRQDYWPNATRDS